jgi:ATP-dependent DNA helicase RecG
MANARGGRVIIGVEDSTHRVVGVPDERIGDTMDVILRAARQVMKPELVLGPPEPEVCVVAG